MSEIIHGIVFKEIKLTLIKEYNHLSQRMYNIFSIGGSILAIDGTLIKISRPNTRNFFDFYGGQGHFFDKFCIYVVDYLKRFRRITYGLGNVMMLVYIEDQGYGH